MDNQVDTSPYKYNTQLHMYRPDVPLPPMQLPEGYILRSARLEDGTQLCHCFRGGYLSIWIGSWCWKMRITRSLPQQPQNIPMILPLEK